MKGVPYLLEALRLLDSKHTEARLVGPILLADKVLEPYRKYCQFRGLVPHSQVRELYAWADVFVLPSLCEGSALVTYEALAAGLPVICTPNTGSVVQDGVSGFVVPIRDAERIADRLEQMHREPGLLHSMSQLAHARASTFALQEYSRRLLRTLSETHRD
jgi:glycosyltransferase involved in cell wall biosynthesis